MMLTPIDIHNKAFSKSFRGYNEDEVNEFLDLVIKDFELIIHEKLELEKQLEALQNELDHVLERDAAYSSNSGVISHYQGTETALQPTSLSAMEQSMHKSIRVAQEVADEVRLNAKKEAELILQDAEKNADRMINEALQKARSIHSGITDMKQKANVYRARFRAVVQSHLEVLDNSDWDFLDHLGETPQSRSKVAEEVVEEFYAESADICDVEEHPIRKDLIMDETIEEPSGSQEVAASLTTTEKNIEEPMLSLKRSSRKLRRKAIF